MSCLQDGDFAKPLDSHFEEASQRPPDLPGLSQQHHSLFDGPWSKPWRRDAGLRLLWIGSAVGNSHGHSQRSPGLCASATFPFSGRCSTAVLRPLLFFWECSMSWKSTSRTRAMRPLEQLPCARASDFKTACVADVFPSGF